MGTIRLATDFREFLKLLTSRGVEYLLIGGYAVAYHGYPRGTVDMDLWVQRSPENAAKLVEVLRDFGFDSPNLTPDLLLEPGKVFRMGVPPLRIELLTDVSGVSFDECYASRVRGEIDGVNLDIIDLKHLRMNKKASGRPNDLNDLAHLPEG